MSVLTKVFVVLLVVLSILVSGALLVFINRVEDFNKVARDATTSKNQALQRAQAAEDQIQTVQHETEKAIQAANAGAEAARADSAKKTTQILDLQNQIAQLQTNFASATAAARSAEAALAVAQGNQGRLQDQLLAARTEFDKVQKQNTEFGLTISDQRNQIDVLSRQLRYANEELAANKGGGAQGRSDDQFNREVALTRTVNVHGVISATQTIDGIKYATISIGKADGVDKGMQLRVLGGNSGSEFLGYVTVTSVEPNEAIGRLSGPRLGEVQAKDQVVSRL